MSSGIEFCNMHKMFTAITVGPHNGNKHKTFPAHMVVTIMINGVGQDQAPWDSSFK